MPQMAFSIFSTSATVINSNLAFLIRKGRVIYFNGLITIFSHAENDIQTFRMITSQFCVEGLATQAEISKAFGIPAISVKRAVKRYRDEGPAAFYRPRKARGPSVLTGEVLERAQDLLDEGQEVAEVAKELDVKRDTLRKAVNQGRLHKPAQRKERSEEARIGSTKSERSALDSAAPMGMGATNAGGRYLASMGGGGEVDVEFHTSLDVLHGGLLFAIPALLEMGLLAHTRTYFELKQGYYRLASLFVLLAFMALGRVKTPESLRYCAPGEWGKLLGLDRIPEVRTLRGKLHELSKQGKAQQWGAELACSWMKKEPESAGVLYVDGHVRVYHGSQTKLPLHYVARERLCLRATVDYWVNAMDGQPFFVVTKEVDPGMLKVLEDEIVPRLKKEVPNQPGEEELKDNPLQHRFTIVFDREGYSPEFFLKRKQERIACLTYHKHPGRDWSEEEFERFEVRLINGNVVEMLLAERGVFVGKKVWVREIRKLSDGGHQTSVLSTDYISPIGVIAVKMFSRWSQENFFRYMREHYNLDRIVGYGTDGIPDTTRVVNPEYRRVDGQLRRIKGELNRKLAEFGSNHLKDGLQPKELESYQQKMAELQEAITRYREEEAELKEVRKTLPRHIEARELPEKDRFRRLEPDSKHLVDTIKMIAYRAETAMVQVLREKMSRRDDARALALEVFNTEADLIVDEDQGTLTVRLHHLANRCSDEAARHLCNELNETATIFPDTELRLVYDLVSSLSP